MAHGFDNADDVEIWTGSGSSISSTSSTFPFANFLLRGNSHGSILITTKNIHIGKALARKRPIGVPIFGCEDAIALLRSRLLDNNVVTDEFAGEITEIPDCISLTIIQAAGFLNENNIDVSRYLELIKSSKDEISDLLSNDVYDDG